MSDDLKTLFDTSTVPAPRAELIDRILTEARTQAPLEAANDRLPLFRRPTVISAAAGIAATLVAGLFVFGNQPNEAELWAAQAEASGFGDLYEWVYSE
ncbi:MAG: hypothetical protein AAF449_22805 [Myxococcota bacterium]